MNVVQSLSFLSACLERRLQGRLGCLVSASHPFPVIQYVEAISSRQSELDSHIAEGYKNALTEERRRYCFLVDRQCALAKSTNTYHTKVRFVQSLHLLSFIMLLLYDSERRRPSNH
ncbi:brain-specific angiogenesis inhibitor 1-associated protein 2 isoform X1 [Tachysurus ichikawai]